MFFADSLEIANGGTAPDLARSQPTIPIHASQKKAKTQLTEFP